MKRLYEKRNASLWGGVARSSAGRRMVEGQRSKVNVKVNYHHHILHVDHLDHFLHVPHVGHLHIIAHAQCYSFDIEKNGGFDYFHNIIACKMVASVKVMTYLFVFRGYNLDKYFQRDSRRNLFTSDHIPVITSAKLGVPIT